MHSMVDAVMHSMVEAVMHSMMMASMPAMMPPAPTIGCMDTSSAGKRRLRHENQECHCVTQCEDDKPHSDDVFSSHD